MQNACKPPTDVLGHQRSALQEGYVLFTPLGPGLVHPCSYHESGLLTQYELQSQVYYYIYHFLHIDTPSPFAPPYRGIVPELVLESFSKHHNLQTAECKPLLKHTKHHKKVRVAEFSRKKGRGCAREKAIPCIPFWAKRQLPTGKGKNFDTVFTKADSLKTGEEEAKFEEAYLIF
eukprot:g32389.t1